MSCCCLWANEMLQPGGQETEHMEITAFIRKWWTERRFIRYRNKLHGEISFSIYRQTRHRVLSTGRLFLLLHVYPPLCKNSTNVQCTNPQEFSLLINLKWLTLAYVCSPVSDLALLLPFDLRSSWRGCSLVCLWSPQRPERAIRVWPLPSVWPR